MMPADIIAIFLLSSSQENGDLDNSDVIGRRHCVPQILKGKKKEPPTGLLGASPPAFFRSPSLADLRGSGDESPRENRGTSSFAGGERRGAPPPGARRVVIYANGFCVDDGEFRPFGVEANDVFVRELKAGVAPRELQQGGREVHVLLDDRQGETYTPPPPPQSLSGQSGSAAAAAAVDMSRAAAAAAAADAADPGAPRTQIMFRLRDGQRTAQQFSVNATVQQLFDFVEMVAPSPGGFQLLEGFPPKPVSASRDLTLKEAGLLNATLSQKPL
ncbi:hypothetical protein Efla_004367 [Eimeria flavescens]